MDSLGRTAGFDSDWQRMASFFGIAGAVVLILFWLVASLLLIARRCLLGDMALFGPWVAAVMAGILEYFGIFVIGGFPWLPLSSTFLKWQIYAALLCFVLDYCVALSLRKIVRREDEDRRLKDIFG